MLMQSRHAYPPLQRGGGATDSSGDLWKMLKPLNMKGETTDFGGDARTMRMTRTNSGELWESLLNHSTAMYRAPRKWQPSLPHRHIHPLHYRRKHLCRAYRAARVKLQRLLHKSRMRGWLAEIKGYASPPKQVPREGTSGWGGGGGGRSELLVESWLSGVQCPHMSLITMIHWRACSWKLAGILCVLLLVAYEHGLLTRYKGFGGIWGQSTQSRHTPARASASDVVVCNVSLRVRLVDFFHKVFLFGCC